MTGGSENANDPLSPAGNDTMTTLERSRLDVTPASPRALPADTKKPICSPGTGWWPIIGPHRASTAQFLTKSDKIGAPVPPRPRHIWMKPDVYHLPLMFTTAHTVYCSGPSHPAGV